MSPGKKHLEAIALRLNWLDQRIADPARSSENVLSYHRAERAALTWLVHATTAIQRAVSGPILEKYLAWEKGAETGQAYSAVSIYTAGYAQAVADARAVAMAACDDPTAKDNWQLNIACKRMMDVAHRIERLATGS